MRCLRSSSIRRPVRTRFCRSRSSTTPLKKWKRDSSCAVVAVTDGGAGNREEFDPDDRRGEQLFAAQRDARREMDKVMYRVLPPEDEVTAGKLLRRTVPDQVTENRADILEAYCAEGVPRCGRRRQRL